MDALFFMKKLSPYYDDGIIKIYNEDCLLAMDTINQCAIDMVLCDPPYGTTACTWDNVIDFQSMWKQIKRIRKKNAAVVMTASQPFTTMLANSNIDEFRYCWVWDKVVPSGFNYARFQPMRRHEDILVFYNKKPNYDSKGEEYKKPIRYKMACSPSLSSKMTHTKTGQYATATHKKKQSIIKFQKVRRGFHPTQKPVELMEYLILTYTNPGETIIDFAMGSGTTLLAAKRTGRKAIGIEIDEKQCKIAVERLSK